MYGLWGLHWLAIYRVGECEAKVIFVQTVLIQCTPRQAEILAPVHEYLCLEVIHQGAAKFWQPVLGAQ